MGTINWTNVEAMPLAIGGAGMVYVQTDPLTPYTTVRVFAGPRLPSSALDAGTDLVQHDLSYPTDPTVGARGSFWGAPRATGLFIQFYALVNGTWEAGPSFSGVDLTPTFATAFPWDADWIVDRLTEIVLTVPPFPNGKGLRVTRAFPRDTHSWPAVNVQVDAMNPLGTVVGDYLSGENTPATPGPLLAYTKGRLYGLTLSITGWCATPEERSLLGKWLGGALEVVLDAAVALGWPDPSTNLRESEDFDTLSVPAFLVNAGLTVTLQSSLTATLRSSYRATLINAPEAPIAGLQTFVSSTIT